MANPKLSDGYTKIANEFLEALAKIRIAGEARQMLDVIIRKTYGYNKKADRISTSQFIKATNISRRAIYKMRKKLRYMNLITVSQKGDSQILTYSIQKDYIKWQLSPKRGVSPKRETGCLPKGSRTVSQKATHNIETIQKKLLRRGSQAKPQVKDFLNYFGKAFKNLFGFTYPCSFGKDGRIAKDLLKLYSPKVLEDLVDVAFDWAKEGGWIKDKLDIGVFKQQLPKIIIKYKQEYEINE